MLTRRNVLGGLASLGLGAVLPGAPPAWARTPVLPTQFLIGYGSLIDGDSRNGTAGERTDAVPVRVTDGFGYRRTWNARSRSGFTALGLEKAAGKAPTPINGVIFPVTDASLVKFDARESGYDRVMVAPPLVESLSWLRLPDSGTMWIYVPKAGQRDFPPEAQFPLLQSYIDLVLQGALSYGRDFAAELIETTDGWSPFWLNDRPVARRPWAMVPHAGAIDGLLSSTAPASSVFGQRLYEGEYAVRHLTPARP